YASGFNGTGEFKDGLICVINCPHVESA
ncbi:MAG: hypothetical protein K0S77_3150, partial [Pseudomonas sp.]|nr:hypothetical protein [Pseudomonas sp.]